MDEVGFTSLHMAADNGHAEIVDILLEAGAKLNPQDSCTAQTPLIMAINKKKFDIAKKLISKGADPDLLTETSGCALHYAVIKENIEIVKMLIDAKADVNLYEGNKGYSIVYLAATLNQVETMKLLIAAGADINMVDDDGRAPLHYAASNGLGDVIKILADNGVDLAAQDPEGKTAEELSEKAQEVEFAAFLAACKAGEVPAKAPAAKVREVRELRTIVPLEGCGEGCAAPE